MNAPDKIYLGIEELDSGYVYALSLENNGHSEYIRKDALLDWLKAVKADVMIPMNIDRVIAKIESL